MSESTPPPSWKRRLRGAFENGVIRGDDWFDAAFNRFDTRFGRNRPRYIAAYRALRRRPAASNCSAACSPRSRRAARASDDDWWDNLLNTYRRFESDEVPGVAPDVPLPRRRASR